MRYHYFCVIENTNMRLGSIFSGFKDKVKAFGQRVGSTLAHVAPKVIKVGSFVSGALSHLPGLIGTAAGYVHKGLDWANKLIGALPNSQFKDKLQDLSSKTNDTVNTTVDKVQPYVQTAKVIGDTSSKVIEAVKPHII